MNKQALKTTAQTHKTSVAYVERLVSLFVNPETNKPKNHYSIMRMSQDEEAIVKDYIESVRQMKIAATH